MEIIRLEKRHVKYVASLIFKNFEEFVASSFTVEGRKSFLGEITEEKILELLAVCEGYVATIDSKIVGVIIASKDEAKLGALFVDKRHHRQGIAAALLKRVESLFRKRKIASINVKSSTYAIGFYEKNGFKKTTGLIKNKNGFTYQPMKKKLL